MNQGGLKEYHVGEEELAALEVTKKLKLHPTPSSWNLLYCRRKSWENMLEYCQGGGRHLGSFFRIHPWGRAPWSGQQCESSPVPAERWRRRKKALLSFQWAGVGLFVVCVLRHTANLEWLSGAVLGATGCSQGWLLWENLFPASTTTQSGARGKPEDMQHSNPLPSKGGRGILHQM